MWCVVIPTCRQACWGNIVYCFVVSLCVRRKFCKGYLRRGLTYGDEIWQDGRPRWLAGHLLFWWTVAQGISPQDQKVKNFRYAYLVHRLREIHTEYFVFEINYKSILYLPVIYTAKKYLLQLWWRRSACGGYTPVRITGVLVSLFLVVSGSAIDCLERLVPEMIYYVLSGTLHPTQ